MQWDEERAGEALRTMMRDTDLPPLGSDVDRARRTGRRQTIGRRAALAAGVAVVVAGTSAAAAVTLRQDESFELVADDRPMTCERVEFYALPPGTATASLAGVDSSGRYAVGRAATGEQDTAGKTVLWKDKAPSVLDGVPAGDSAAVAVNSRGDVVGSGPPMMSSAPQDAPAWLYRDGKFQDLVAPKGLQGAAVSAINDRGDIAGTARQGERWVAVVWPAGAPDKPRRLDAPNNGFARWVAADGTAVGESAKLPGKSMGEPQFARPYLWTGEGRGRELNVPAGWEGGSASTIKDGWALGKLIRAKKGDDGFQTGETVPVRWRVAQDGPPQFLGAPSESSIDVVANTGWFVSHTLPTGWAPTVLTYLDGRIRRGPEPTADPTRKGPDGDAIPLPVIGDAGTHWVSEKGRELTVIADGSPEEADPPRPGIWKCQI